MSLPPEAIAAAEEVADGAVSAVIESIRDAIKDRRDNAYWWAHFHAEMWRTTRPIRFIARAHHRRMARRYTAMVRADRALARICSAALPKV